MKNLVVLSLLLLIATAAVGQTPDIITVDETKTFEDTYVAKVHTFLDGKLYRLTIACSRRYHDCAPLQVGDKFMMAIMSKTDPDKYQKDPDGMILTSVRVTGENDSMVYFVISDKFLNTARFKDQ